MIELFLIIILPISWILWKYYQNSSAKFGAPFVPLDPDVVLRIIDLTDVKEGEAFYDLGSGDGRIVIAAALRGGKSLWSGNRQIESLVFKIMDYLASIE